MKKSENDQEGVDFFFCICEKEVKMTYFTWGIRHSSNDSSRGQNPACELADGNTREDTDEKFSFQCFGHSLLA